MSRCRQQCCCFLPSLSLARTLPRALAPPNPGVQGQPAAAQDTAALAKATQNPVASLISVPIQNSSNFGVGPYNRTQNVINIQPVIPVRIRANWNLITRIIQPIVWQPYPASPAGGQSGLWRHEPSLFLISRKTWQVDLGSRSHDCDSNSYECAPWPGEVEHGSIGCRPYSTRTLDPWSFSQQRLFYRRFFA